MTKFKQITHAEFKALRKNQWLVQAGFCPILKQFINYKDAVFDHKHKNKSESIGEDGKGLLRGVMHFQANSWEGKVTNAFKRYGLHKFGISLPDALRNLAKYIESPPMPPIYIHPDELPKAKKLGKRDYNLICKYYFVIYPRRKKLPEWKEDKRGRSKIRMNKEFEELLEKIKELKK